MFLKKELAGGEEKQADDGDDEPKRDPLVRTKMPFGGLIDDIKCRYPQYLSDLKVVQQCQLPAVLEVVNSAGNRSNQSVTRSTSLI